MASISSPRPRTSDQQRTIARSNHHATESGLPSGLHGVRPDRIWLRPGAEHVRGDLSNARLIDALEWMHTRRGARFEQTDLLTIAELERRAWTYGQANRCRTWSLPTWADPLIPSRRQGWVRFVALLIGAYRAGSVGVLLGYHEAVALVGGVSTSTWYRWIREMEAAGLLRVIQTWAPDESGERPRRYARLLYRIGPVLEEAAGPGLCEGATGGPREIAERWAGRAAAGARARARAHRDQIRGEVWADLHAGDAPQPSATIGDDRLQPQLDQQREDTPDELEPVASEPEPEPEPKPEREAGPHAEPHDARSPALERDETVRTEAVGTTWTGGNVAQLGSLIGSRFSRITPPPPSSGGGIGAPPSTGPEEDRATREKDRPTAGSPPAPHTPTHCDPAGDTPRSNQPTRSASRRLVAPREARPVSQTPPTERESAIADLLGRLQVRGLPCQRGPAPTHAARTRPPIAVGSGPGPHRGSPSSSAGWASGADDFQGVAALAPLKRADLVAGRKSAKASTRAAACSHCRGTGFSQSGPWPCVQCAGKGKARELGPPACSSCEGSGLGEDLRSPCSSCDGIGREPLAWGDGD